MWRIFLGRSDRGGIGGLFRDPEGKILVQFGKKVPVDSAMHTEFLVFREGILAATTSRWASSHSSIFESDSLSVVT